MCPLPVVIFRQHHTSRRKVSLVKGALCAHIHALIRPAGMPAVWHANDAYAHRAGGCRRAAAHFRMLAV